MERRDDELAREIGAAVLGFIRSVAAGQAQAPPPTTVSRAEIRKIVVAEVRKCLHVMEREGKQTAAEIVELVAVGAGMHPKRLIERDNSADVAPVRHLAMYLCHTALGLSLSDVGKAFGGRHHAGVAYAVKKVRVRIAQDRAFARRVEELAAVARAALAGGVEGENGDG